jgi:hypothetical protein
MKQIWTISTACVFALAMGGIAAAQTSAAPNTNPTMGGTSKQMEKSETDPTSARRPDATPGTVGMGTHAAPGGRSGSFTNKKDPMEKSETNSTAPQK